MTRRVADQCVDRSGRSGNAAGDGYSFFGHGSTVVVADVAARWPSLQYLPYPVRMARLQYSGLMIACLVLTLPLEFVFGARVWRQPRRLAIAVLPVLTLFVVWDLWATHRGTWSFNPDYTIGWTLPGGMVVEEFLFFVTIPVCTLLTLESVRQVMAGTTPVQAWLKSR